MRDIYALLSGCAFLAAAGGTGALYASPGGIALALILAAIGFAFLVSRDAAYEDEIDELHVILSGRDQ